MTPVATRSTSHRHSRPVPSSYDPTELHPRAEELIAELRLLPHPEGGFFREIFRSSSAVRPADGRPDRAALTTIFFLLAAGGYSRWHRVSSDEVWHFYEGDPLELCWIEAGEPRLRAEVLGPVGGSRLPVHTVPAGAWQAARTTGAYSLVGCTVGPGFEFADFQMLADHPREQEGLLALGEVVQRFL